MSNYTNEIVLQLQAKTPKTTIKVGAYIHLLSSIGNAKRTS